MLEYSCSNCKHSIDAKEFRGRWAGLACTKIQGMSHDWTNEVYIVDDSEDTVLIVDQNFLCVLHEPKE